VWWGYKAAGKTILAGGRAGARMGEGLSSAVSISASGRAGRRGYLAPGDPTPPPTVANDYLDYRGVAAWQEARNLTDLDFQLGSFIDLGRGRMRGPIGLPPEALNRHAVVIGPAGSGKTSGLLVPWIHSALRIGWAVVAVDVKGSLREEFLAYKASAGGLPGVRLRKWDFTDATRSTSWNWLAELTDDARVDAAITAIIGLPPKQGNVDPYFYQRDYRTLRGLLKFVRATAPPGVTAGTLIEVLEDRTRLEALLMAHPSAPGASDLAAIMSFSDFDYSKVISGVVTGLSALDSEAVAHVTREAKLDLDEALQTRHLLIVGAPLSGGQVSVTLSGLMLGQLKQRLFERFSSGQGSVLFVIDEAPQLADRVDVAQLMEVARSAGVGVVVAFQDAAKIRDENDRSSILSNAATLAMLPGASPLSVEALVKRLGQRFERTHGLTSGGPRIGWTPNIPQQTLGTEAVPVLREREISQIPFGTRPAVVHVQARELGVTTKPMLVDLYREP
jgi:type IV secretory pathway TraG/TraD family ATPase VirD4